MTLLETIEMDVISGVIVAAIIALAATISNSWRTKRNESKRQQIIDNRFKEALITLAESFDDETLRLHPNKNIPLVKPRILRLVSNGDEEF